MANVPWPESQRRVGDLAAGLHRRGNGRFDVVTSQ